MYRQHMYFDAHFHLFNGDPLGKRLADNIGEKPDEGFFVEKYHTKGSLTGGIVMGTGPLNSQGKDLHDGFFYCLGLYERDMFPLGPSAVREIEEHLRSDKCVGIKLYPGYVPIYPDDPQYSVVFDLLINYNKVLAVHTGMLAAVPGKLKYTKPIYIDDIAVDHPRLKIVMCHFGNPFLSEAAAVMEHNKNVYADLSGLLEGRIDKTLIAEKESGYVDELKKWINYVGYPDRFIFGSDWPAVNIDQYADFISSLFDRNETDRIMYKNALEVYGINL